MNNRSFLMLAAVTAVAAVLSLTLGQNKPGGKAANQPFLPALSGAVNEVEHIVQSNAEGTVATLQKGESEWTIDELDGYPADWPLVRATLSALAEARVLEFKTSNPEYHDRLGLAGTDVEGSGATQLDVSSPGNAWSVLAGDVPDLQFGQYARLADDDQAVLIDKELELPDEAIDWADRQILDIGAALVAGVEIRHRDGEVVRISKVSADDSNFSLETLPESRELQSGYMLNSAAGIFAMLEMDAVRADESEGIEPVVECEVTLFSGLKVTARVIEPDVGNGEDTGTDRERWLRVTASLADPESADDGLREQLQEIQTRTGGWLYRVSSTRMDTMTRRNEAFLKPLEDQ